MQKLREDFAVPQARWRVLSPHGGRWFEDNFVRDTFTEQATLVLLRKIRRRRRDALSHQRRRLQTWHYLGQRAMFSLQARHSVCDCFKVFDKYQTSEM